MAKPSWLNLNPTSGSGDGTIKNSASEHTGRIARTGEVTVQGVGISEPKKYKVTQTPKDEFVSFDDEQEIAVAKGGGTLTITGKSNSAKLKFSWAEENGTPVVLSESEEDNDYGSLEVNIPETYTASGKVTNNDTEIEGDPGAENEYNWSIELEIPKNPTIEEVVRNLIVEANGGQKVQIAIKQAAGEPYLELPDFADLEEGEIAEITIPQDGSEVSVNVLSNTSWTVS